MTRMMRRATALLLAGASLAACGGGSDNNPAVTIAKTAGSSGDAQTATVATALPTPLSVTVTEDGAPKAGVTVQWARAIANGGGTIQGQTVTDAAGVATSVWTLGPIAGPQGAIAQLPGAGGSPVNFTATATADVATAFTKNAGDAQNVFVNTALGTALSVKIADQFGNGIAGITVNWAVQSGSATVAGPTSVTNASGIASIGVTAGGTAGAAVVRATNGTVAGNLDFTTTVVPFPTTAAVTAALTSYTSVANASRDPAVDTIGVGGTVTWSGLGVGTHRVRSTGSPSFTTQTVNAVTYQFTFNTAGDYDYDCTIHGNTMTGTVVVR